MSTRKARRELSMKGGHPSTQDVNTSTRDVRGSSKGGHRAPWRAGVAPWVELDEKFCGEREGVSKKRRGSIIFQKIKEIDRSIITIRSGDREGGEYGQIPAVRFWAHSA